ncbi:MULTISPECIES: efflux RND transporter permease subunit [unclassified Candidatus Frackibacter]|uniref:efflux RND transporter permease subunit n=1 Tax=unclassified Candidatus Frackibacter TaxID=2648818 RepID=UPI00087E6F6D|nr:MULTISPECIES: MMPL family transporter [unclassified Candidatus Frackibacter]SDC53627.1 hypothetical protein SAMN04515661_1133 [Candidatus Frackibacter sp. WG11]SEM65973.1 hypothetical protein SAMN04488698_1113 [Candidatus Frackibacter sp. WG12]SFL77271.1 hypothetical protein SAMN04488699_1133 [Candidatus Frackibacter sp. WG13]
MYEKILNFTMKYPRLIIVIFIVITLFFALQLPNAKIDTAIKNQIPKDMPSRLNMNKIKSIFGGTEIVIIGLKSDNVLKKETLVRIKELSNKLDNIPQVKEVNSLFNSYNIQGSNNEIIIEDIINTIPNTFQEEKRLREKIKNNRQIYNNLISKNFKLTSIILVLKDEFDDKVLLNNINKIIKEIPGEEEVFLIGLPIIRAKITDNIRKDIKRFLPLGLIIVLIFLYLCFKQLRGVLLPLIVVIMSIIVALGSISLFKWKIQLITVILPVILLAIANDYAIHIITKYQEEIRFNTSISPRELSKKVIKKIGKPIMATGITTIIGLLSLLAHIIVPAQQLAILSSIGVTFALLASLIFIPAILSLLPKVEVNSTKINFIEKVLFYLSDIVTIKSKSFLIISSIIIVVISYGMVYLVVDTNPINYFGENTKVVQANRLVSKYFGGSTNILIVAKGDIKDPIIMKKIGVLEKKLEDHKDIERVSAISDPIRKLNKILHNDIDKFSRIPNSKNAISQYLMLYSMLTDFEQFVDFNYKYSLISARINTNSTNEIRQVIDFINRYIDQSEDSPFIIVGGYAHLLTELVDSVVYGQINSLFLSLIIVMVIVIIVFRSFIAGIFAIISLVVAVVSLFGLMGYLNIELNIITSLLSSIMIGVGVDYTIHFLWRYKEERSYQSINKAIKKTLQTTGKAIIFNAFSVIIGFMVLITSNFLPVKSFGFLIVISITSCLLSTLIILPVLCVIFNPKFLNPKK